MYLIRIQSHICIKKRHLSLQKSIEALETRYKNEAFLMECIAHGDYRSIESMEHLNTADIKPRLSDSIRDRKNFMIILNTPAVKLHRLHIYIRCIWMKYRANLQLKLKTAHQSHSLKY